MMSESQFVSLSRTLLRSGPHWLKAKELLSGWFERQLARNEIPIVECNDEEHTALALWAARVYKRGLTAIRTPEAELTTGAFSIEGPHQSRFIPSFSRLTSQQLLEAVAHDVQRGWACVLDEGFLERWPHWKKAFDSHPRCIVFCPSESEKEFETLAGWWTSLQDPCAEQDLGEEAMNTPTGIWSVGGGITTDMGGFLAGMLGVPHRSSPTTLLSAADASVGGKTGVNFGRFGKNQLGLFSPTEQWVVVPEHFGTLSQVDIACGLAETVKHLWLVGKAANSPEFDLASQVGHCLHSDSGAASISVEALFELVRFNFEVKSAFVKRDPFERSVRKALNLGHTTAHLIEGLSEAGHLPLIPHGLAVAAGLIFVSRTDLVKVPQETEDLALSLWQAGAVPFPLRPTGSTGLHDSSAVHALVGQLLAHDKKNERVSRPDGDVSDENGKPVTGPNDAYVTISVPEFGQFSGLIDQSSSSPLKLDCTLRVSLSAYLQKLSESGVLHL